MPSRKTLIPGLVRGLLLAACAMLPAVCWAARPVPVFAVDVAGQTPPELQQAMRAALVRATGRQEAATDPVFAALIANAPQYVVGYQRGPQGEQQVIFNSAAVAQAIAALGRSLWDPVRPFTIIVLYPPPDQAQAATDDTQIEQAAEARGLPISIVPLPVADQSGNLLSRSALLQMTHRYGADQLLIGQPPAASGPAPSTGVPQAPATAPLPAPAVAPTSPPSSPAASASSTSAPASATPPNAQQWQWTLETDFTSQTWSGSLATGIDQTVDLLAPPPGPAEAAVPRETHIQIDGVRNLADYANIELMLAAVPGVSAANVLEVNGTRVVFSLMARGGEAAVARALTSSPRFAAASGSGGLPVFRYNPE